jgi:hypothetical protein
MATNLNDTTPAAPTGGVNCKWQQDASGNTSAYVSLGAVSASFTPVAGVLTIDASQSNVAVITINAAITSSSVTNPTDGQLLTVLWEQDSTGHAVALPSNFIGATPPSTTASKRSIQTFLYNAGVTAWFGIAAGQTGL